MSKPTTHQLGKLVIARVLAILLDWAQSSDSVSAHLKAMPQGCIWFDLIKDTEATKRVLEGLFCDLGGSKYRVERLLNFPNKAVHSQNVQAIFYLTSWSAIASLDSPEVDSDKCKTNTDLFLCAQVEPSFTLPVSALNFLMNDEDFKAAQPSTVLTDFAGATDSLTPKGLCLLNAGIFARIHNNYLNKKLIESSDNKDSRDWFRMTMFIRKKSRIHEFDPFRDFVLEHNYEANREWKETVLDILKDRIEHAQFWGTPYAVWIVTTDREHVETSPRYTTNDNYDNYENFFKHFLYKCQPTDNNTNKAPPH